jgi:hypothetical protein
MEASMNSGTVRPITHNQLADAIRSIRPSIGEWMETAKNYAMYGNDSGAYDELAATSRAVADSATFQGQQFRAVCVRALRTPKETGESRAAEGFQPAALGNPCAPSP